MSHEIPVRFDDDGYDDEMMATFRNLAKVPDNPVLVELVSDIDEGNEASREGLDT